MKEWLQPPKEERVYNGYKKGLQWLQKPIEVRVRQMKLWEFLKTPSNF